jgi:hypothetical protein
MPPLIRKDFGEIPKPSWFGFPIPECQSGLQNRLARRGAKPVNTVSASV